MKTVCENLLDDRGWNLQSHDIKRALGLSVTKHLPREGLAPQMIVNVWVWVNRLGDGNNFHRVRCVCPCCNWEGSAGRLRQHMKIHK